MSDELKVGDAAPDFRAAAVGGGYDANAEVSLKDFRGKTLVLYFYPKDDTPGCTAQACGLRDAWDELKGRATIFGVSTDSVASHDRFIGKYRLPFPLLSDATRQMARDYHVWVEKNFMGRKSMGVERTTFVIDEKGRISAIFRRVKPDQHAALVSDVLTASGKN
jgi:thioredoxin-dependent peroxiredoxin